MIFSQEFSLPISFAGIKEWETDLDELRKAVSLVGEQPSIYTTFTLEKTEKMVLEAIIGMKE